MGCPLVLRFAGDAFDEFDGIVALEAGATMHRPIGARDYTVPWPADFRPTSAQA
jgi:hypothetical protein